MNSLFFSPFLILPFSASLSLPPFPPPFPMMAYTHLIMPWGWAVIRHRHGKLFWCLECRAETWPEFTEARIGSTNDSVMCVFFPPSLSLPFPLFFLSCMHYSQFLIFPLLKYSWTTWNNCSGTTSTTACLNMNIHVSFFINQAASSTTCHKNQSLIFQESVE